MAVTDASRGSIPGILVTRKLTRDCGQKGGPYRTPSPLSSGRGPGWALTSVWGGAPHRLWPLRRRHSWSSPFSMHTCFRYSSLEACSPSVPLCYSGACSSGWVISVSNLWLPYSSGCSFGCQGYFALHSMVINNNHKQNWNCVAHHLECWNQAVCPPTPDFFPLHVAALGLITSGQGYLKLINKNKFNCNLK